MSRVLVAYFSASGVTAKAAAELAAVENADLYEIRPETPYTAEDLNWRNAASRSTVEMKDPDCRPPVTEPLPNMEQYGAVFVGFPIWWGREPSVVDTFLTGCSFDGKTIVPFCTSGGSGLGKTAERIRSLVGPGAKVEEGMRLGGEISEADLRLWTEGLGL